MRTAILVSLICLIFLSGCSHGTVLYTEPGTTIEVQNRSRFTIELASNVTTGYSWDFAAPVDTDKIKVIKSYYSKPQNDLVGAGGTQGWIFETVTPGSTTIILVYKRPWEKSEPPIQTATFSIVIN